MADVQIKQDLPAVAQAAAELSYQALEQAVVTYGQAVWVLAGGATPAAAYEVMAQGYADKLDWQHVFLVMGDERQVPAGHPDSNWTLANALLERLKIPPSNLLRPPIELPGETAAKRYAAMLSKLPTKYPGIPRLDHVWLGMGEDGHTLSLFPDHPALDLNDSLVVPVHDSPKPPSDRISLSLHALQGVDDCLIMVTGVGKAEIVARVLAGDAALPITRAVQTIETAGGRVTWLLDEVAASQANLP